MVTIAGSTDTQYVWDSSQRLHRPVSTPFLPGAASRPLRFSRRPRPRRVRRRRRLAQVVSAATTSTATAHALVASAAAGLTLVVSASATALAVSAAAALARYWDEEGWVMGVD